jgi:hypothetical protein
MKRLAIWSSAQNPIATASRISPRDHTRPAVGARGSPRRGSDGLGPTGGAACAAVPRGTS